MAVVDQNLTLNDLTRLNRNWRVTIFSDFGTVFRIDLHREIVLVENYETPDAEIVKTERKLKISRSLDPSDLELMNMQVTTSSGKILSTAEVMEAFELLTDSVTNDYLADEADANSEEEGSPSP